jgi:hypothetical protein
MRQDKGIIIIDDDSNLIKLQDSPEGFLDAIEAQEDLVDYLAEQVLRHQELVVQTGIQEIFTKGRKKALDFRAGIDFLVSLSGKQDEVLLRVAEKEMGEH